MTKIWFCKIGEVQEGMLPGGADAAMRKAVTAAYVAHTGESPDFIFSGWGGMLTEGERAVLENRMPDPKIDFEYLLNAFETAIHSEHLNKAEYLMCRKALFDYVAAVKRVQT